MSFRGRGGPSPSGRGGFGGRSPAGRGFSGGRGGGRGGGGRGQQDDGPPAEVTEVGTFMHSAESEMVCRLTHTMIPYFNAGIYLENKAKIGKVEEVFGPINKVYFTIKVDSGVNASSFKSNDKVFIALDKLLPLARFTNPGKSGGGGRGGGRGAAGGRGPPGRGGGGRGPPGRGVFGRGGGRGAPGGFSRGGGRGGGRGRF